MRRSQTLSGLSSSVKNTLKTAIAAGLAATFENSQEAEEQEWDEAKVSGAPLPYHCGISKEALQAG